MVSKASRMAPEMCQKLWRFPAAAGFLKPPFERHSIGACREAWSQAVPAMLGPSSKNRFVSQGLHFGAMVRLCNPSMILSRQLWVLSLAILARMLPGFQSSLMVISAWPLPSATQIFRVQIRFDSLSHKFALLKAGLFERWLRMPQ